MDTVFLEFTALGIDIIVFGVFYRLYQSRSQCIKSLKEAKCFEIDSELTTKVKSSGNVVPYAVVSGTIKALTSPLRSQYFSHLRGVIREKIVRERKVRWSPILRLWNAVEHDVQHTHNSIPFALWGNSSLFKKQMNVEVMNPLSAEELVLSRIYDKYTLHEDSIADAVLGFFRGERITGIQEIENMLLEGTILTGIGELVFENEKLKLRSPRKGLTYFLTTHSLESLIKKLDDEAKFYKMSAFVVGTVGILTLFYILKKAYSSLLRKYTEAKQRKMCEEARKMHRITETRQSYDSIGYTGPTCVVCLINPVEMLILECGHACLCLNCSEQITAYCPVCRSEIVRLVPAYLP